MRSVLLAFLLVAVSALAKDADFTLRIQEAQNALLSSGSTKEVLFQYDTLIADINKAQSTISAATLAQVYYRRSLVELSMNKIHPAISDLVSAIDLDPSLTPAATKLRDIWLERGQFADLRRRFSEQENPDLYHRMSAWENAYAQASGPVEKWDESRIDESLELVKDVLLPTTPHSLAVYELHIRLLKRKAVFAGDKGESFPFELIVRDYSQLIKLAPLKDLNVYSEMAQFLLFTQGKFQDGWSLLKTCLRIDNENSQCGRLTKMYSRLQSVLGPFEEYYILHSYLYPDSSANAEIPSDKLDANRIDYQKIYSALTGPVNMPQKEMENLPEELDSVYDFVMYQAREFASKQFADKKVAKIFPFVDVMNKLACEASVRAKGNTKKYCGLVSDREHAFLPKHLADIDALLKRKKYHEAKQRLSKYSSNVQKTDLFRKRWRSIQEYETMQHRKQQQQHHRQHQQHQQHQRQQQQQQQQQARLDRNKDYYKILDVSKDADEKTLKKAYRTQTLKYHPDKNRGTNMSEEEMESKMQDINEAYEVLSNPDTRANYDHGPQQHQQHHRPRGGGSHFQQQSGHQFHFNPEEFMGQFMGRGRGGFNVRFS